MKRTFSWSLLPLLALQPLHAQTASPHRPNLYSFLSQHAQHSTGAKSTLPKTQQDSEDSFDNFAGKWLGGCQFDTPDSTDSDSFDETELTIESSFNGFWVNGVFFSTHEVAGMSYNNKDNAMNNYAVLKLVNPNEVIMKMVGTSFFLEPSDDSYSMMSSSAIGKWTINGEELKLELNIHQELDGQYSQNNMHCVFKKQ